MVVSEPQKPIAVKSEYLPSRFHYSDKMTNIPRINAPSIDPTAKNTNSKPFIIYF
ncbi:MAG: hypothetical protein WD717_05050 [Nitrosarchaeum sp.]